MICLAQLVEPLIRPDHTFVYHWSGRPSALFGPAVVEVLVLFVLLAGLLFSARYGRVWRSTVWATLLLSLPWIIFHEIREIWPDAMPHWLTLPPYLLALVLCPLLILIWTRYAPKQREKVIESATVVLAFMALSSFVWMSQLLWFWWKARALNRPVPLHQPAEVVAAKEAKGPPRIIWILLDELSYQQVYQRRFPGLQLPAFDQLAKDATVFTNVVPAANFTERAIPSLLNGHVIGENEATADGMLLVRSSKTSGWRRFDGRDTVFEDAINAGYRTAVVGWYNPYCRILSGVLDRCYWVDDYIMRNGLFPDGTLESNIVSSVDERLRTVALRNLLERTLHAPENIEHTARAVHLQDYRDLVPAADEVLLDRSARFVFLHLPIPHPNGIYDRRSRQLTTASSTYIDNLALCDRYLAHVRKLLESSGQWDSSVILVMGDHGWRTSLVWEGHPEWSPEEQQASQGQFDERPAYIVKLAEQTIGSSIDTAFNAVETRALVDEVMAGKISTPRDLKAWVENEKPVEGEENGFRSAM